ncbi:Mur ligase family protein [Patescibacteria group bacterium]
MKKILISFFLYYLRIAASLQLKKINPKIIALTGSVGKSSLRDTIYAVLKDFYKCKKSVKANSETGIPLDILGLHLKDYSFLDWLRLTILVPIKLLTNWEKYDYYIVELGIDEPYPPKNMEYLLKFIHPNIAVFLNVALVHAQQFEKIIPKGKIFKTEKEKQLFLLSAIAKEKGRIITQLSADKTAIVNFDDVLVYKQAQLSKSKVFYFGKNTKGESDQEIKIQSWDVNPKGTSFVFTYLGKHFKLDLPYLLPGYYAYNLAVAMLTGLSLGLEIKQITSAINANFTLPAGRMFVFKGIKDTILLDSSYNASKFSVLGVLDLVKKLNGKKIFVFGDMRELGNQAKAEHRQVAKKILTTIDILVLVGPLTKKYVLPVISSKIEVHWFENSWQASLWLKNNIKGKEIILIKGSQNTIYTEIVVESLLADKKDIKLLCRRGKFWDKQRKLIN